jgi:sulfite reductase (NADPH) hemoprotein beta-component
MMNKYPTEFMITPNQDALFTNITESAKKDFEADLAQYGFGKRNGKTYSSLRLHSGACVGRDTCRLTYTDSEKFEPELIDELEKMGWGDMKESIGITGCERQCFRPATKTIGLVGSGLNRYQFKLMGDETGQFQGKPLMSSTEEKMYLRSVPREKVTVVIDALFKNYKKNAAKGEGVGAFHRRVGADALIAYLQNNPDTKDLMEKPADAAYVIE